MPTALQIVQRFFPNVTLVRDTKRPLKIEVTPKDCKSKAVKDHRECALAVACKRSLEIDGVIIALRAAYLIQGNTATRFGLGDAIAREVTAFDRMGSFEPGTYQLLKPNHKIGDPSSSGSRGGKRSKKKPSREIYRHITTNVRGIYQEAV